MRWASTITSARTPPRWSSAANSATRTRARTPIRQPTIAASGINLAQFRAASRTRTTTTATTTWGKSPAILKLSGYFVQQSGLASPGRNATQFGSDPANYDLDRARLRRLHHEHLQLEPLRLQTGLRMEGTTLRTARLQCTNQDAQRKLDWDTTGHETSPTSILCPAFRPAMPLPATPPARVYARGISRPNQYDLVPYVCANGQQPGVTVGNPNELPTHANNYDLLLEQQLKPFGLIQTGFFYKQLTNPIFADYTIFPPPRLYYGISGACGRYPAAERERHNAYVSGLELLAAKVHQSARRLPRPGPDGQLFLHRFGHQGLPERTDSPALWERRSTPSTSNPVRVQPLRGAHGHQLQRLQHLRLPVHQQLAGRQRIRILPAPLNGPCGDNYFYPHFQVDAQMGIRLYHRPAASSGRPESQQRSLRLLQRQPAVHDAARVLQADLQRQPALELRAEK